MNPAPPASLSSRHRPTGRRPFLRAAAAACAAALTGTGWAADPPFPQRPISIIVPFAAGGSLDLTARIVADKLRDLLGQPVLIVNRPGAGSAVGARALATAAPDGYTLFLASGSAFGFLHLLVRNFDFTLADFAPIGGVAVNTSLFVVQPNLPAKTLPELVALSRSTPGGLSFCSTGVNGLNHLQLEMFKSLAQAASPGAPLNVTHVPYNGVAPALTALRSGAVQACSLPYSALIKNIDGKEIRVLAVQRGKRLPALPNVPSTGEQGFGGMDGNDQLVTLSAPRKTPPAVLARLEAALQATMQDPAIVRKLDDIDVQPTFVNAADAQKWLDEDVRKFEKIIRDAKITAQD